MSSDIHALVGAYAVDALDDAERAEFEQHLAVCEACQAEVASLTEAASHLGALTSTEPPAQLRDAVLAAISTVRPLAPLPTSQSSAESSAQTSAPQSQPSSAVVVPLVRRRRTRIAAAAVAAAILVAAAVGGVAAWHPWSPSHSPVALTAAQQVIEAADVQRTRTTLDNGASLTVYRSPSLDRAVLVTERMPVAAPSKVYEVWLEDGAGTMHPAALMPHASDATVVLRGDAAAARGVGITVEPAGGSAVPTSAPVALLPLEQS